MTLFAVRSEKQRRFRNGQMFIARSLERAITKAFDLAKQHKKRMYVVVYAWREHPLDGT